MTGIYEDYWTNPRIELQDWFRRNAPSLGELYEASLIMIYDDNFPGRTRFIAHAVREIRNRLPDVICGAERGRMEYTNRLDELFRQWTRHGFTLNNTETQSITRSQQMPETHVPFPLPLFRKISDLVREHVEKRETQKERATRLFEAISTENQSSRDNLRPVILQWIEVTNWFVGKAHDSGAQDSDMNEEEIKERFELFENTLGALLRGFFNTIEGLDEILENANA